MYGREEEKAAVVELKKTLCQEFTHLCVRVGVGRGREAKEAGEREEKSPTQFSLFRWSRCDRRDMNWQQFYVLVLALAVSVVAIVVRYFLF